MRLRHWPIRTARTCNQPRCIPRSIIAVFVALAVVSAGVSGSPSALADAPTKVLANATSSASGCVPTTAIKSGDLIAVTATLTTTDPNENGEGEDISIQSTGGFNGTVSTYNQAVQLPFYVATMDGETFSCSVVGGDGDEAANVVIDVNPTTKRRFSDATKRYFAMVASRENRIGIIAAAAAALCTVLIEAPPVAAACVVAYTALATTAFLLAQHYNDLTIDPTDPNFTVIAQPVFPDLASPAALPSALAVAFKALLHSDEQALGFANAMQVALNRAQGAADAGSTFWESKQTTALYGYAAQLANVLDVQGSALTNFTAAVDAAGFPPLSITAADALSYEDTVASSGLPSNVIQALVLLGATPDQISQIRLVTFVQDINTVAGVIPDPQTLSDLHALATSLRGDVATHLGPLVSCQGVGTHMVTGSVRGSLAIVGMGSWCVRAAQVSGLITISGGANVLIEDSTISGAIITQGAGVLAVCSSSIRGAIHVSQSSGFVVIGDPSDDLCGPNQLQGTVDLAGNNGGVEVSQNTIGGALIVNTTSGNGADHGGYPEDIGSEIEGNTVHGTIACLGNNPIPSNDGEPNEATTVNGQCPPHGF